MATAAAAIEFVRAGKAFDGGYVAVDGIDLRVETGRFVSVVGPSGCGKSTLLNLAAGLLPSTSGEVRIFGAPLAGLNPRAGYLFQQDALLPWKTVLENVKLGPSFRGRDAHDEARQWIARVGLSGFEDHYPAQLSGGMRKRVALAQTWIANPDIVLMDEPFSALDVHTRVRMETEVLELWSGSSKTVLFVTHDLEEAIGLGDEVVVLSAGPASRIVARFPVDLPRPRPLLDIRTEPRFHELYALVWSALRSQVMRSYERPLE
jgi:NitT/TauT family transport system ATP-binding protein